MTSRQGKRPAVGSISPLLQQETCQPSKACNIRCYRQSCHYYPVTTLKTARLASTWQRQNLSAPCMSALHKRPTSALHKRLALHCVHE
eukprot:scaffold131154_cov39-Phaeocystis_antarctica.AAC.1